MRCHHGFIFEREDALASVLKKWRGLTVDVKRRCQRLAVERGEQLFY
jgi:hypothetical protein